MMAKLGRRQAAHEYAKKDVPWIEDMGRRTRRLELTGFLVADSLLYGGGDIEGQIERMAAACEAAGPGLLVHPDFGELTVSCDTCNIGRDLQGGVNVAELQFVFLEAGKRQFPSAAADTSAAVATAAQAARTAAGAAFAGGPQAIVTRNETSLGHAVSVASAFVKKVTVLASSATSALQQSALLSGNNGRYVNGRNIGFLAGTPLAALYASYDDLTRTASDLRAQVAISASAVVDGLSALGIGVSGKTFAGLIGNHVTSIAAAAADPAGRLQQLQAVFDFDPADAVAVYDSGAAIRDVYRTAAAIALAAASAGYQPASYDDAAATRAAVTGRLGAQALAVADAGHDDLYSALTALRAAVVRDFQARGDDLQPLIRVDLPAALPSLRIAMKLYGDASRTAELEIEADPVHPLFMPAAFNALAA